MQVADPSVQARLGAIPGGLSGRAWHTLLVSRLASLLLVIVCSWIVLGCRASGEASSRDIGGPADPKVDPPLELDPAATHEPDPIAARTPEPPLALPTCQIGGEPATPAERPLEPEPEAPAPAPASKPASPSVSGFPQFDPLREATLWGKLRPDDAPPSVSSNATGSWHEDAGRLTPASLGELDEQLWFPHETKAQIADGLVRMRVELAGAIDVSLLLRQNYLGDPPRVLSGYDLSITGDLVRLHRWDRGMQLPMGPEAKLAKLGRRTSLEVVVTMVGPQLFANVYDGDTLEHLASAAVHDTTYAWGCVGLRVGAKHDPNAGFRLLSAMDTRWQPPHARERHAGEQRYGMMAPSDITPFGNTRFAWIRSDDLPRLPKPLRTKLEATVEAREPGEVERALLFLDTIGYERLLRSGVEVLAIDSNAPWSAYEPAFRQRASESPRERGRGFVLDDAYKDPALVEQLLRAYADRYPNIATLVEIGRSHQNRPIWALKISDDDAASDPDEPSVLLDAAHHGSELLSIEYVLDAIDSLVSGYGHDPQISAWVEGLEIWCVPLVNVDGNHMFVHESRFAIRKNGFDGDGDGFADPFEGVDLNRNYPFGWGGEGSSNMPMHKWFRGPAPGSEPETQAMMGLAERERFAAALSFHTFGTDLYSAYGLGGARNPKPDINKAIGREIAAAAPEQPNQKFYAVRKGPYPVAGSDQDWHLHEHGTVAFILEGSHHNPTLDLRTLAVEATRPVWQALLERVHRGPWIGGHIRDGAGNPVLASVRVAQVETFEGERWTTRARDGRFDRPIDQPGKYTLIIEVEGQPAIEREVVVGSRRVDIDIVI